MTNTVDQTTIQRGWQTPFLKIHPSIDPYEYTGDCSRLQGVTKPLGDVEHTECMDGKTATGFREDSEIVSRPGSVTGTLAMKKSIVNAIKAELWDDCRWNIDIRLQLEGSGSRSDQMNWNAIDRYIRSKFTEYSTDDETVYTRDDQGEVMITMPFSAPPLQFYNLRRLESQLIDTDKAGNITCITWLAGETCPTVNGPAEGCKMAVGTAAIAGNPFVGLSTDGGQTWTWFEFDGTSDTPTWTNDISGISGIDDLIVVTSNGEGAHAYSNDAGATWAEVTLADYAAHAPRGVVVESPTSIWICGDDGYIWKSKDGGNSAFTADGGDPGIVTASNLVRVKALSDRFVIAVGASNAIVKTENGGETWSLVTGPAAQAAVQVNSIGMWDQYIWLIVYEDGEAYWTDDGGASWTEDEQLTNLGLTALNDVAIHAAERYLAVGEDGGGNGIILNNVHGAPGKWLEVAEPSDCQEFYQVITCDQNLWVTVGETTYVGGEGAIVRAVA